MVKYRASLLNRTFSALGDPTRRAILERLAKGDSSVTDLAAPFDMSLPAISKHLRILEQANLLMQEKDGRVRRCSLSAQPLQEAAEWMARYECFWTSQLSQLAMFLDETQHKEESPCQPIQRLSTPRSTLATPSRHRRKKYSTPGRTRKP